jgi:hypothetical protein
MKMYAKSVTSLGRGETFMGAFESLTVHPLYGPRRESGTRAKNAKNRCRKFTHQQSMQALN